MPEWLHKKHPQLAVLIDPDHQGHPNFHLLLDLLGRGYGDLILVGGSTSTRHNVDELIEEIRAKTSLPIILFPGNSYQLSPKADALLVLSLISGRNPEYLIGKHVEAAPMIKSMGLDTIPTGYIMISNGKISSAAYMTQTIPIPQDKPDIAVQTALAGEMLGMKAIYLEGGSGAEGAIPEMLIKKVRKAIDITLIVGGGFRYPEEVHAAVKSGAEIVVIGTVIEEDPEILVDFHRAMTSIKVNHE